MADEDDSGSDNGDRALTESPLDKLKRGIAGLTETLLSKESGPTSQELGKALEMFRTPSADQEVRLNALLAILSKPETSIREFVEVIGIPVIRDADPECAGALVESCLALLSLTVNDTVEIVDHTSVAHNAPVLTPAEAHDQLLLHFASFNGGAVDEIRTKFDWANLFGESLDSVIAKLKARGALVPLEGAKWHVLYNKSAEELLKLCSDHGLNAFGTREELAERLVSVDPSGLVLGYPGELLKCSSETRRSLAHRLRQGSPEDTGNDTEDEMVPGRLDPFEARPREQLDLRKPECPYCDKLLPKIPGRKTKCPHCGRFMFVRTRPEDGARVVVTQAEADRIENDWSIVTTATDPDVSCLTTSQEVEEEREKLSISFGSVGQQKALDDDVKWSLLNKVSTRHAAANEWGLYRNIQIFKADFLARRCKFADALKYYIYVCALDLNAPQRRGLYPQFLDQVARICKRQRLGRGEVRDLLECWYVERALTLSLDECWSYLQNALWPSPSSLREDVPVPGRPDCIWQVLELPRGTETIPRLRSLVPDTRNEFS